MPECSSLSKLAGREPAEEERVRPQISRTQKNTMKVVLMQNPTTVVTRFISEPSMSLPKIIPPAPTIYTQIQSPSKSQSDTLFSRIIRTASSSSSSSSRHGLKLRSSTKDDEAWCVHFWWRNSFG